MHYHVVDHQSSLVRFLTRALYATYLERTRLLPLEAPRTRDGLLGSLSLAARRRIAGDAGPAALIAARELGPARDQLALHHRGDGPSRAHSGRLSCRSCTQKLAGAGD
jgi:hypothetical protein